MCYGHGGHAVPAGQSELHPGTSGQHPTPDSMPWDLSHCMRNLLFQRDKQNEHVNFSVLLSSAVKVYFLPETLEQLLQHSTCHANSPVPWNCLAVTLLGPESPGAQLFLMGSKASGKAWAGLGTLCPRHGLLHQAEVWNDRFHSLCSPGIRHPWNNSSCYS